MDPEERPANDDFTKVHTYRALRDNIEHIRYCSWFIWLGLLVQSVTSWVMYGLGYGNLVLVYGVIVTWQLIMNLWTLKLYDRTLDQPESPLIVFSQVFTDGVSSSFFYWMVLVSIALQEGDRSLSKILLNSDTGHQAVLSLMGAFLIIAFVVEISCLLRSSFLLEFRAPTCGIDAAKHGLRTLDIAKGVVRVFELAMVGLVGYSGHITNNGGVDFSAALLFAVTAIQLGYQMVRRNRPHDITLAEYCFVASQHALVTINCVMSTILLVVLSSMGTSLHELFQDRGNDAIITATVFLSVGVFIVLLGQFYVSLILHQKKRVNGMLLGDYPEGGSEVSRSGSVQED